MNLTTAPYLSLRHARTGRLGEDGLLPPAWSGEHTSDVSVLEVGSAEGKASLVVNFRFGADSAGDYGGLSVSQYLTAAKGSIVVLAGQVTVTEWTNAAGAFMVLREWRDDGEFVSQSMRPLRLGAAPQIGVVAHEVCDKGRAIQPLLMAKRQSAAPGSLTVKLTGLAFGNLYDHPRWLWR